MLHTQTTFTIPKMDCPCEEQMVRMALASCHIVAWDFDIPQRTVTITHTENPQDLLGKLEPLGLGTVLTANASVQAPADDAATSNNSPEQRRTLTTLLLLNAIMFVVEGVVGWLDNSAGLLADGLDMLSDALVYGIALFAVGKAASYQLTAARFAGIVELGLAALTFGRVGYQIVHHAQPEAHSMVLVSLLALAVNVYCLYRIGQNKHDGVHMKASYIFSANDVIANTGVIVAGVLVAWLGSPVPDWIIGCLIGIVVTVGAVRILRLR